MEMFLILLFFIVGLAMIIKGGDFFVDAASWFAEATGIPKFIVGATIVSFATTLPELLVSIFAVIHKSNGIAIGNAIGSVTANLGLILGISIVVLPAFIDKLDFMEKGILMISATALLLLFSLDGSLNVWEAAIIFAILIVFFFAVLMNLKKHRKETKKEKVIVTKNEIIKNLLKFVLGALGIVIGAQLLVENGGDLARILGVPESIIGITLIAVGTALPELVTTLTALSKKESALGVGNILGANIIDITLILPICAFISGGKLKIEPQTLWLDIPFCATLMLIAVVPTIFQKKFKRYQGIIMLALYAAYIAAIVSL